MNLTSKELLLQKEFLTDRLAALRYERDRLATRLKEVEDEINVLDPGVGYGKLQQLERQIRAAEWREWAETLPRVVWADPRRTLDLRVEKVTPKTIVVVDPCSVGNRQTWHIESGRGMLYPIDSEKTWAAWLAVK